VSLRLPNWSRRRRNLVVLSLLGGAFLTSYVGAFALELGRPVKDWAPWFGIGVVPVLVLKFGVSAYLCIHRGMWRYTSSHDLIATGRLVAATSLFLCVTAVALPAPDWLLSVAIQDFLLSLLLVGGVRMTPCILLELGSQRGHPRRVLVLGAGDAGEALVRELARSSAPSFVPVAILDDDPSNHGKRIHGVPVVGALDTVGAMAEQYEAEALLLAIYAIPSERLRQVRTLAMETGLPLKRVPAMAELLAGRARIHELHDFSLEELLDREPIRTDRSAVHDLLAGRCALVTGAAGSIGSELSRQILASCPAQLILLDNNENALFHIEQELRARHCDTKLTPTLCSVQDADKLRAIFKEFSPDVVFHAAAYKHVPVLEHFPEEAVRNNIGGTLQMASLAHEYDCGHFVLISTDKAVRPTSVMGATKRVAELIVADIDRKSRTAFSTIRFGNVLGSNGSVIQLFRRQIAEGGPVTITHPEMRRFFMSIPEAVELVLFAAAIDTDGGTFILEMGEQVRILDLAHHFIRLHGFEPGRDIPIEITGLRPGEKLFEELWTETEQPLLTGHPGILRAPRLGVVHTDLAQRVATLLDWAEEGNRGEIIAHLRSLVPAYSGDPVCASEQAKAKNPAAAMAVSWASPFAPLLAETEVKGLPVLCRSS
jgi:FlaA1/EpsC-like NDP-sugar epimerase